MDWRSNIIQRLYSKKIDAAGLAVFRIAYSLTFFCEVAQLYYFKNLVFDKIPFVQPSEIDPGPALVAWMTAILCITFGLFTRQAAVINYLFSLVFIATTRTYEYHMFYAYMGINFLLIFLDVSKSFSLDNLRLKLKYSSTEFQYVPPSKVSVLNYYIPVLIGIGFVYFDSVFHKLDSDLWTKGLGFWLPASVPQVAFLDHPWLLNNHYLVIGIGYLTLVFEILFLFLFPVRKLWPYIFTIGFGLHVGILLVFPIPWFALGVMSIYLLFIPNSFWRNIQNTLIFSKPSITYFYDSNSPLSNRIKIILAYFDFFKLIKFQNTQLNYSEGSSSVSITLSPAAKGALEHELNLREEGKRGQFVKEGKVVINIAKSDPVNAPRYVNVNLNVSNNLLGKETQVVSRIFRVSTSEGKMSEGFDALRFVLLRIPVFALAAAVLYTPLLDQFFRKGYNRLAKLNGLFSFTEENSGYVTPKPREDSDKLKILSFFTWGDMKTLGLSFGLMMLLVFQLFALYQSPVISKAITATNFDKCAVGRILSKVSRKVTSISKTYFGITGHGVFLDDHFVGYNHIVGIEYIGENEIDWLPIINKDGAPGKYLRGFTWAKWSFRVTAPKINASDLERGIRDFTAFWLNKTGRSTEQAKFKVHVKKIETPKEWTPNFLEEQREKPWMDAGMVEWNKNEFHANILDIEKI